MKRKHIVAEIIIFILVSAISSIAVYQYFFSDTHASWVERVSKPNYRLLSAGETASHYFAVFDAGDSNVAICLKKLKSFSGEVSTSYEIQDMTGKDLHDFSAPDRSDELYRESRTPFYTYSEIDGVMYPIQKDHTGKIKVIVLQDSRTVLEKVIQWTEE